MYNTVSGVTNELNEYKNAQFHIYNDDKQLLLQYKGIADFINS